MNQYKNKTINNFQGQLYIVSTPIGNLSDITQRALFILQHVDLIAAEDTRRTSILLKHFDINTCLFSLHAHNEKQKVKILIKKIKSGQNIALVSDAGTPLINDPGYYFVNICHNIGIRIIPIPGPCAAIAALSVSGLPINRFCYEGFLPSKSKLRRNTLKELKTETRTLVFYESSHRLIKSLEDIVSILGNFRYMIIARELTKTWETIYRSYVKELLKLFKENENYCKGEIVLIIEGYKFKNNTNMFKDNILRTVLLLQKELSLKKSVEIAANIHGIRKNKLYKFLLEQKKENKVQLL